MNIINKKCVHFQSLESSDPIISISNDDTAIHWESIYTDFDGISNDNVLIGTGSFGIVVKAKIKSKTSCQNQDHTPINTDIALKILTCSAEEYKAKELEARDETYILTHAYEKMLYKNGIVRVYGIVTGILPADLAQKFNMSYLSTNAVGIIMKYEGGGTLKEYVTRRRLGISEKIRIMESIVRGLSELHALGIVHGDIKLDNVLLSSDSTPQFRLADFGLSTLSSSSNHDDENNLISRIKKCRRRSSLKLHVIALGTPVYSAPEMLPNSIMSDEDEDEDEEAESIDNESDSDNEKSKYDVNRHQVAKPSRKTDMYAFGILSWEIAAGETAFSNVKDRDILSDMVHEGIRPLLSNNIKMPMEVTQMIKACWHTNRYMRYTAIECLSLLQKVGTRMNYDIYFSYHPDIRQTDLQVNNLNNTSLSKDDLLDYLYEERYYSAAKTILYHLIRLGYRVCFDFDIQNRTLTDAKKDEIRKNIRKSSVFVVYGDINYLNNEICMYELKCATMYHQNEHSITSMSSKVASSLPMYYKSNSSKTDLSGECSPWSSKKLHSIQMNQQCQEFGMARTHSAKEIVPFKVFKQSDISASQQTTINSSDNSNSNNNTSSSSFTSSLKSYIRSVKSNLRNTWNRYRKDPSSHDNANANNNDENSTMNINNFHSSHNKIVTLITQDNLDTFDHPYYRDFLNYTGLSHGVQYSNISQELAILRNEDIEFINTETLPTGDHILKIQNLLQPFLKLLTEKKCVSKLSLSD